MHIRKLAMAAVCAGGLIAPLSLMPTASAAAATDPAVVTIKTATLRNGAIVVTGTYKCPKAEGPAKFIEFDARQWQGVADDELTGVAAVRTAAKGKPLDCTGRHRAFETVTIASSTSSRPGGLTFVPTDIAKEDSSAVLEATMFTQDDYGYGYGVFHLKP